MVDVTALDRSPFGVNCHEATNAILDRLADAGIQWFRFDLRWKDAQPEPERYDWERSRRIVQWAAGRRVSLLAVLVQAPQWAWAPKERVEYKDDEGQIPRHPQEWVSFVAAVVQEFGPQIQAYSIWNEPNLHRFWHGDRRSYLETILRPGIDAIRRADPDHVVVGPDLSSSGTRGEPTEWLAEILKSGVRFDVLTHHQYDGGDSVEGRMTMLDEYQRRRVSHGMGDLPFWVTEIGFRVPGETTNRETQAKALESVIAEMWQRPWWEKTFWYDSQGEGWGLFEGEEPCAALGAYAAVTKRANLGRAQVMRLALLLGRPEATRDEERRGMAAGSARTLVEAAFATREAAHFLERLAPHEVAFVLYEKLLDRSKEQVDAEGLQATIAAIEAGNLADRIVEMLDSPEFVEKFGNRGGEP